MISHFVFSSDIIQYDTIVIRIEFTSNLDHKMSDLRLNYSEKAFKAILTILEDLREIQGNEQFAIRGWGKTIRDYGIKQAEFDKVDSDKQRSFQTTERQFKSYKYALWDLRFIREYNKDDRVKGGPFWSITPLGYLYLQKFQKNHSEIKLFEFLNRSASNSLKKYAKKQKAMIEFTDKKSWKAFNQNQINKAMTVLFDNVDFVRGASVSCDELTSYFDGNISRIGNVNIKDVIDNVDSFIDLEMDNRKEGKVKEALGIANLNSESLKEKLLNNEKFAKELIQIYRTDADEFNYCSNNSGNIGVLSDLFDGESVDAVFLDSGEFVSLVEWEIVAKKLRKGGYVFLHDIYFPKSFKNWLVCASIAADPEWEILYQDKSTPQGMMLAKKLA